MNRQTELQWLRCAKAVAAFMRKNVQTDSFSLSLNILYKNLKLIADSAFIKSEWKPNHQDQSQRQTSLRPRPEL